MSLEDFLNLELREDDAVYNRIATELKDYDFNATKITPPGIRHLSDTMSPQEKHFLLWDILMNSTPNYRKAVSSKLRRMVAQSSSRSPTPEPSRPKSIKNQQIYKPKPLPFYNGVTDNTADIEAFIRILKETDPWWYVLNVDHEMVELSSYCYDTVRHLLNPMIKWEEIWSEILPIIGSINLEGRVRLRAI